MRCAHCAHEKLVAFSCKRRGFCPSCGARRMAESAAHPVDQVIPRVPIRQWVLSLPIPLRILFAAHPEWLTPVLRIIHRVIAGFLRKQAGLQRAAADTGAVTLIQRFGSAANLNIHLHCLVLDGVYRRTGGRSGFPGSARLLKRVFDIDLEHCAQCGGELKIIAAIEEPVVIVRILTHLGLPARASPRAPARRLPLFETG